jgi:hypothetical protein
MDPNTDSSALSITPQDFDLLTRTVIGEAGNDPSAAGVAAVALNRLKSGKYGQSLSQVVTQPGQFEAWQRQPLMAYSQNSPAYAHAAQVVSGVLSGQTPDPTNGATQFYAPAAQAALGRKPPAWDDGTGQQIGKQRFFGGKSQAAVAEPDYTQGFQIGASPAPAAGAAAPSTGATPEQEPDYTSGFNVATPPQAAAQPTARTVPADAVPGQNGLSWNKDGGYDPKTGELVIAGKPFSEPTPTAPIAASNSFINGIPIVGPALESGVQHVAAGANALLSGTPFDQNLSAAQSVVDRSNAAYPKTAMAGGITGGVAGTIPAMMEAPAMFGVGAGNALLSAGASAITGAGMGGADSFVRSGGNVGSALQGAELGGAFGAIGPLGGKIIGGGTNALSNALARTNPAARNVSGILSSIGMTPGDAQNALARIGPHATLADVDPALRMEAGGLASTGGEPTSILKGAMATRAAGADDRVAQMVDTQLGPKPDLTQTVDNIQNDAQTRAGPAYTAGRSGAPMDVMPVISNIDAQLPNASGAIKSLLSTVKGYLTNTAASASNPVGLLVPKDDPGGILGARQALDDLMYNRDTGEAKLGPNAMRVAGDLRGQIDQIVKTNPDFAQGDAIYAQSMGIKSALQQGVDAFKNATRIEDMTRATQAMTPQQLQAYQQGARVAIGDAMDNAKRGEFSAAQGMFSRGTANRAKLDLLFPNASGVFDSLQGEAAMRETEQEVAQNSATAGRRAVQQKYSAPSSNALSAAPAVIGEALGGGGGALALSGARALYGHLANAATLGRLNALKSGTASALAASGTPLQSVLGQVSRAYGINGTANALSSGAGSLANLLIRTQGPPALTRAGIPLLTGNAFAPVQNQQQ